MFNVDWSLSTFKYSLYITIMQNITGVYPQSPWSLATVDIDASKGFVDLWVHLSFAIFVIFNVKRLLKLLEMANDQVQTCLIFPMRWAGFPIKFDLKVHFR